jgi:hypothetical protein
VAEKEPYKFDYDIAPKDTLSYVSREGIESDIELTYIAGLYEVWS